MNAEQVEALRRYLIDRFMTQPGISWTCSSERLVMRAHGGTLCKIGRDGTHVLVEFRIEDAWREKTESSGFVFEAPPGETPPEKWRQARLSTTEDVDRLVSWLL